MSYSLEQIIATDDWSEDRIEELRAALGDAEVRRAVRGWLDVCRAVGDDLRADLPGSGGLVLFALRGMIASDQLSADERAALDAASGGMKDALERHPSVRHILDRIRDDAGDFERCWNEVPAEHGKRVVTARSERSDRPPAPRPERIEPARPTGLRVIRRRWPAVAATVAVLAVAAVLMLRPGSVDRSSWTADAGTYLPVDLPDGSLVRLVGPATLGLDADRPRTVDLEGSAFFDVRPGEERFTITTPVARVEVLGTTFGIRSDEDATDVTLVSGALELASADNRTVVLAPGQSSRVASTGAPSLPEAVDLTGALRWAGLFVFRDTPLADVARTLGEEFDIRIDVAEELGSETLTGTFAEEQGIEEILRVISAAVRADLDVYEDGARFTLSR